MKHIKLFEEYTADEIRDKDKIVNNDPKLSSEIGHFHDLQKEIKSIEEDLMKKKAEFKQFEDEIRPMLDCMKQMGVKLSLTEEYLIKVTRFGGERKDVSYKNAFENALSKVNAATKKVLEAALEASKNVTQVKHSFVIDKLAEASLFDTIKEFIKSGIDKLVNIFKKEEDTIDSANAELEKLTK